MEIKKIFILGAGTMGAGIAQVAASSGFGVTLMDIDPGQLEKARKSIARSVEKLFEKELITSDQKGAALKIETTNSLPLAAESDFIIEAATEDFDIKAALFLELRRIVPPGVILGDKYFLHQHH